MTEPKCPECKCTELNIKLIVNKLPHNTVERHTTSVYYCLKCGKVISVHALIS